MHIMQIGEKAGRLSEGFREKTKRQIPWQFIRGMRNALAHNYENMTMDRLWNTIHEDIPQLKTFCEAYLPKLLADDLPPILESDL